MVDTVTANYGWIKPEIAGSASTWGGKLNGDLDLIDSQVFANQTALAALNAGNFNSNQLVVNKPSVSVGAYLIGNSAGLNRWYVAIGDGTAESGANAGSNFQIYNYSDSGAYLGNPLTINRATGRVSLQNGPVSPSDVATKAYVDMVGPIGSMVEWPGVALPNGWTWALGQVVAQATYPILYSICGTRFNTGGEGTGNFRLPNKGGKVSVGYDGSGWAMGATGGEVTHTLTAAEMPVHGHGVVDPTHAHGASQDPHSHTVNGLVVPGSGLTPGGVADSLGSGTTSTAQPAVTVNAAGTGISIQNAGGGAAHNNMPPYIVIATIIRVG